MKQYLDKLPIQKLPEKDHVMGFVKEFKEFAVKGNVIDLAVGVIIGAAFGKIVDSLVKDIIMPPIGFALKGVDFSNLKVTIIAADAATKTEEVAIRYGQFINAAIHFTIVAFAVFLVVKQINRLKRKPENLPPSVKECPNCLEAVNVKALRCKFCTSDIAGTTSVSAG